MSKIIIWAIILLSLTMNPTMTPYDYSMQEPLEGEGTTESTQPYEEPSDTISEEGFLYISSEFDLFSYIETSGWYYENYSGMAIFYNQNSFSPSSSIAVSSSVNPVDEAQRIAQTTRYIDAAVVNLESIVENIELSEVEELLIGEYTFYRYQYTATIISGGMKISGEYLYWWVGDREYTCSMFCLNEDLNLFSSAMEDISANFMQPSSME